MKKKLATFLSRQQNLREKLATFFIKSWQLFYQKLATIEKTKLVTFSWPFHQKLVTFRPIQKVGNFLANDKKVGNFLAEPD